MEKLTNLSFLLFISLLFIQCQQTTSLVPEKRWSEERAWQCHQDKGGLVGSNVNPSTSINPLEFWQEDTFDPETIDSE